MVDLNHEFASVKSWARSELSRHGHTYQTVHARIESDGGTTEEPALKCVDPSGITYFVFSKSSQIVHGDLVVWEKERWKVFETSKILHGIRCKVTAAGPLDVHLDDLLRSVGLSEAADYMANAQERLHNGAPAALADCKAACRNALLSAVARLTGKSTYSDGVKELKAICSLGDREQEYLKAFEQFLLKSKDLLSKAGPHPPMPEAQSAIFAYDLTKATLRFVAASAKSKN